VVIRRHSGPKHRRAYDARSKELSEAREHESSPPPTYQRSAQSHLYDIAARDEAYDRSDGRCQSGWKQAKKLW